MPGPIYEFGPFQLDADARRLTRDGAPQAVSARHADVLVALVARAGTVVSKDTLVDIAWREIAVTDNSLEQAVSALRRTLGPTPGGEPYIQTVPRQGYRFVGDVRTQSSRASDAELDALIAPHRAWVEGRAALESLAADRIAGARAAFERVLAASPDDAIAHIGIANAYAMQFETTRASSDPDVASLAAAASHAREACRRDPRSGEAWATNGFILDRTGHGAEAVAALGRAVSLEPDNWRHHFRLSLVSWGEARLRCRASHAGAPAGPARSRTGWRRRCTWLDRTSTKPRSELRAGIESMEATPRGDAVKFPGVALEWLLGLIELSRGAEEAALTRFKGELALEGQNHLYGRECCANAWYAVGAVHLRRGRREDAAVAFQQALDRVPRHPAAVALPASDLARPVAETSAQPAPSGNVVDLALAEAIGLAVAGAHARAAATMAGALSRAEPGSQGWWLPVEPMLAVTDHPGEWAAVLAQLRSRAA